MPSELTVNDALEAIAQLSPEDQMMIAEIIRRRLIELRRHELAESVRESREEYIKGLTKHGSVDNFIDELERDE
ncbi:MAG: hypothetical protein HY800_10285 [Ignavibacteriales bacterium]|nr:hypothetical protein [Ignavibacteriales bacterium]